MQSFPEKDNAVNCTTPNTHANYKGQCECDDGWFGDSPVTERGCWRCEPKCSELSECKFPGRCFCKFGLEGPNCTVPTPIITSVQNNKDIIHVEYDVSNDFHPTISYCKIGNIIVNGYLSRFNSIDCETINEKEGNHTISISFDRNKWSNEERAFVKHSIINDNEKTLITKKEEAYKVEPKKKINIKQHKQANKRNYLNFNKTTVLIIAIVFNSLMLLFDIRKKKSYLPFAFK